MLYGRVVAASKQRTVRKGREEPERR